MAESPRELEFPDHCQRVEITGFNKETTASGLYDQLGMKLQGSISIDESDGFKIIVTLFTPGPISDGGKQFLNFLYSKTANLDVLFF